jgi:hypothetical protein
MRVRNEFMSVKFPYKIVWFLLHNCMEESVDGIYVMECREGAIVFGYKFVWFLLYGF